MILLKAKEGECVWIFQNCRLRLLLIVRLGGEVQVMVYVATCALKKKISVLTFQQTTRDNVHLSSGRGLSKSIATGPSILGKETDLLRGGSLASTSSTPSKGFRSIEITGKSFERDIFLSLSLSFSPALTRFIDLRIDPNPANGPFEGVVGALFVCDW